MVLGWLLDWHWLLSSDHMTFFQSSIVQCLWAIAKSKRGLRCLADSRGRLDLITAFIADFFKWWQMVLGWRGWLITLESVLVTWTAFSALWDEIRWIAWWILAGESLAGRPPTDFWRSECFLEWSLDIAAVLTPVLDAMERMEWPESSWERMAFS